MKYRFQLRRLLVAREDSRSFMHLDGVVLRGKPDAALPLDRKPCIAGFAASV